jgi:hypothetical protein
MIAQKFVCSCCLVVVFIEGALLHSFSHDRSPSRINKHSSLLSFHSFQESEYHLWNCETNDKEQIRENTIALATRRFSPLAPFFPPLSQVVDLFFKCDPFFSQGLVSAAATQAFSLIPTDITCLKRRQLAQTKALLLCSIAFIESFHSLVWIERNNAYHRSDPVTLPVTPLHDPPPLTLHQERKRPKDHSDPFPVLPPLIAASKKVVSSRFCYMNSASSTPLPPTLPAVLSAPAAAIL